MKSGGKPSSSTSCTLARPPLRAVRWVRRNRPRRNTMWKLLLNLLFPGIAGDDDVPPEGDDDVPPEGGDDVPPEGDDDDDDDVPPPKESRAQREIRQLRER